MNEAIYRQIELTSNDTDTDVYFVGGCIRDIILNKPVLDIDLIVYGQKDFVVRLSRRLSCALICLDKERDIYRLAFKNSRSSIDITLVDKDVSLIQNLSERDFTINAMAVSLVSIDILNLRESLLNKLFDPFSGRQDIEGRIIRMVRRENFLNDPLRLFRAFRLGAQFGFDIHKDTLEAISENTFLINKVSPERVHEEWMKLMNCVNSALYVKQMKDTALLEHLFPELKCLEGMEQGNMHIHNLWDHSLYTLFYLEEILNSQDYYLSERLKGLLQRLREYNEKTICCLKMAALFHDLGKPEVKGLGRRGQVTFYGHPQIGGKILKSRMKELRFSNEEIYLTTKLVQDHMRPFLLWQVNNVTKRAIVRLFINIGELWPALLALSVADFLATKSDKEEIRNYVDFISSLYLNMNEIEEKREKTPFITGKELMRYMLFPSGPLMGKALRRINQAYLSGEIGTKEEAFKIAETFLIQKCKEGENQQF